MLIKNLPCLLIFLLSSIVFGQKSYIHEIPENWKIIKEVHGDLNKDGIDDLVIIIEEMDAEKFIKLEYYPVFNTNPRGILVFFKDESNNYTLIEKNMKGFIHSEGDLENRCLIDPLGDGDFSISKNVLSVKFYYFFACGTWSEYFITYKYRFQNRKMELIGLDNSGYSRGTGDEWLTTVNFSTKKKEITTGSNYFDEDKSNRKTVRESFEINQLYSLENSHNEIHFIYSQ